MRNDRLLDHALALAAKVHAGQFDLAGRPYIEHVERVVGAVPDHLKPIAALHDALEDTDLTAGDLVLALYPPHVVAAVEALTRCEGETYTGYLLRLARNASARAVKLADLEDNLNADRLPKPLSRRDRDRLAKYREARALLLAIERLAETMKRRGMEREL